MGKYIYVQMKRLTRILPFVLCVVVVLFGGMSVVYSAMLDSFSQQDEQQQFGVGMVGTANDDFLQMGLAAIRSMDSLSFSITVHEMTEQEAMDALRSGQIAAYVVFPEEFMSEALSGRMKPLDFVTTTGAASIVSMVKEEFTDLISDIILAAQKGSFGIGDALRENGHGDIAGSATYEMSLEFVDLLLSRDNVYRVEELGIADNLGFDGYLLCGLTVVFLLFVSMPFAPVFVKRDLAPQMLLGSKGLSPVRQVLCEACAYLAGMLLVLIALLTAVGLMGTELLTAFTGFNAFVTFLPVVLFIMAFSMLIFEVSESLISGVLLHFFLSAAMSFVSGCMYPIYFFPEGVQKASVYLPTAMARTQLSTLITDESTSWQCAVLLVLSAVCLVICVLVRKHKIAESGR